ncbi:MAG: hypothetical protein AB9M60_00860, partial [Leptothrix sp. (in: b-proteobacteria)]
ADADQRERLPRHRHRPSGGTVTARRRVLENLPGMGMVVIIGSGRMGSGIAAVFLARGHQDMAVQRKN